MPMPNATVATTICGHRAGISPARRRGHYFPARQIGRRANTLALQARSGVFYFPRLLQ